MIEIGVGVLFLIGFRARLTALVLAVWCIATAMVAHYHPGDTGQMIHFMKNVCMAGGFLQVVAFGAGRISVDRGSAASPRRASVVRRSEGPSTAGGTP